jgi:hypothetical protein
LFSKTEIEGGIFFLSDKRGLNSPPTTLLITRSPVSFIHKFIAVIFKGILTSKELVVSLTVSYTMFRILAYRIWNHIKSSHKLLFINTYTCTN